MPHFEISEVVLVYCNIINNDYQQDSRVLYTFVPNKSFGSLLEISPAIFTPFKTFNSEFQAIEAWFTDQKIEALETEDRRINSILVIKSCSNYNSEIFNWTEGYMNIWI